ncbi:MAG: nickel pincer cofactor biosynthesis protein LarC [Lachnospiraceae bacterium]|nr:nickel pincer cofactor biosynthesis protein LarC [Lachnospiraceae bacterium]
MENKNILLECESGISGDMFVAALLDLGKEQEDLQKGLETALQSLPLPGFTIRISRVKKAGIDCCDFDVIVDKEHENHDHDMAYLFGHLDSDLEERHEHQAGHEHHSHHEEHHGRTYLEIKEIIQKGTLTENTKELALRIFAVLGEAEAKAHGTTLDEVHFHEVGSVDSIVDIVSAAYLMDALKIDRVYVDTLCEGRGTIRTAHGILPIPVPAVSRILEAYPITISRVPVQGELVTPTGAAILASICDFQKAPETYQIQNTGIGAGKREYEVPSMVRVLSILPSERSADTIWKLECNVDDAPAEELGYCMDKLFAAGARDVHFIPCMMKKNRPGTMISVICSKEQIPTMEDILFHETTTIGIRRCSMERTVLPRKPRSIETAYGSLQVKECTLPDGTIRLYPEYDSMRELAEKTGKSMLEIRKLVD